MNLDSKMSAVVTGGASGLGAATARALAKAGIKVAIFDVDRTNGERIAEEIQGNFQLVDVTSEAAIDSGFIKAREAIGQERICVSCAGIGTAIKTARKDPKTGSTSAHPLDEFRRIVEVNLIGSFAVLSKSAAGMLTLPSTAPGETRGVLINTGSIASQDGQMGQVAYAAAKGGILSMTLPMARDLAGNSIRAATIMPGLFDTPILKRRRSGTEVLDRLKQQVQFPARFGNPAEFASLVMEMCRNDYMNGDAYRLDGALRLGPG